MAQAEQKKDAKQVVVELTMTLEEARQVIWQGRGSHEPMGKLLDSKQLDRGDLAWAVDMGYEPKFREAARTLLAYSIGQPGSSGYGPRVVEGSHYLEEQESLSMGIIMGLLGCVIGIAVANLAFAFQQILSGQNWLGVAIGLVITLLIIGLMFWFYIKREVGKYRTFRFGREGEEEVVERLRASLDNRWTIFRNLHLPGHDDDIDIVLVGPGGVWAVEAKSSRATVRAQGMKWEMQKKSGWVDVRGNPSFQVTKDAKQLNDFLKRQGIVRWVERAIALAESQPITNFVNSEIPIWLLPTIEERAKNLSTRTPPTESEISKIVEILKDLATKQIAKEESKS
jgi:hypothetical protein